MGAMFVKFWGTRGSIPTPGPRTARYGGNTSCVEVRHGDTVCVCDGGTGLRELGVDLIRRAGRRPLDIHLFFSHPHWDHIQGFPFFGPAYQREHTLHLYGEDEKLYRLLSGQMRSAYFPVRFGDLKSRIQRHTFKKHQVVIDGLKVKSFSQHHPGGSLGFSFEVGARKVVFSTDNELDQLLPDVDLPRTSPDASRPMPAPLVAFTQGADLLIADGQYGDDEYLDKAGWGHPRASTCVDLAVQGKVKQLALFHHDPMQSDREVDAKVQHCGERARSLGSTVSVFGAREGMELKVE